MKIDSLQVGYIGTNCYILSDGEVCAVIDPGGDAQKIAVAVENTGCAPKAILLTHSHYDHTGAVEELQALWPDVPVYRSSRDAYKDDRRLLQLYPELHNTLECDEGDVLQIGSMSISVMATPGHSKGSLTFRCENSLFCGDTLFAASCGRTDLAGGDTDEMMASLRRLAKLEGNLDVYPGHMRATFLDREREYNPYIKQALRDAQ